MKLVFIGDIHGRDIWKAIIAAESDADHFVFIGDYFDSFEISGTVQLYNAKEIVQFKKDNPEKVTLLLGNHDHHYNVNERYAGYQMSIHWDASLFLNEHKELFQIAKQFGNIICSHAGLSPLFLNKILPNWTRSTVVEELNDHYRYKPNDFNFVNSTYDPYGDDPKQGPLWIRPRSLMKANKGDDGFRKNYIQIVGHTQQDDIYKAFTHCQKAMGGKYYLIDALHSGGYLVYENDNFIPKHIENNG